VLTGWAVVYSRGDTTYWRRPGKATGVSATTNHQGSDLLYIFSTSTEFETERGYNRFSVYTILNHGGNFNAAARALASQGYGVPDEGICADRVDPATVDLVWERLVEQNSPATLFRRQRKIVMPVAEEITSNFNQLFSRQLKLRIAQEAQERDGAQFAEVDPDLFTELVARSVKFTKVVGRGDNKETVSAYPSPRLVKQVAASPVCPLPLARGIIRTPSYDALGTLLRAPGYHSASGIFYAPPPGFVLPDIPPKPSRDDVQYAIKLWNEVVGEFPFVDDAGHAHMLALPITVLARELIKGPVPMCLVSKPVTGTGGTLLLQCIGWIVLGEPLPESSWSSDEEELRKFLTTLLMRGRPLVNLDNITYLQSKDLLSVLSGDVREDRRLGGNELLTIPNRAVFVGSGNNITYNEEHAGRLYVSRLDAGVENPRLRDKKFKHSNLLEWTKEHRPMLVAALLTIIQAWLDAGRPAYTSKRLAGFEAWSNVVGGILQHAQVNGFLENRDLMMNIAQRSQDEDIEFVTEWYNHLGTKPATLAGPVKTKELFLVLSEVVPAPRAGSVPTTVTLGRYLEKNIDKVRVLDDGTLVAIRRAEADKHTRQQRWILEVLHTNEEAQAEQANEPEVRR
jgi:putative DNA primase/helicase